MDIPRPRKKSRKPYVYGGIGAVLCVIAAAAISDLEPSLPSVERSLVVMDSVRRGTMIRQVRAPGSLVPERIRFVPALTAGRVERKLVEPGTAVDASTLLLELSNPEVQLELLEAQRELSAARQQLVSLQTSLEMQRLDRAGVVATLHAQLLEARRNACASRELVDRGLISEADAATAQERAEELASRYELEQERLAILSTSIEPQLDVQRGQVTRLTDIVAFQQQRIASMRVPAGMDGVLRDLSLEEGQWVLPGQQLATVVNAERLKAVLRVPQVQAREVMLGQEVFVDTRTDTIAGRVSRIDPAVEGGAVAVDVALQGELPQGARPDLSVDGTIEIERLEDVLHVGRPASGQAESTVGLYRMADDAVAERVRVRLGRGSVNEIQVLEGLSEGDLVIVSDMVRWEEFERVRIR